MAGFCSAHKHYEEGCNICRTAKAASEVMCLDCGMEPCNCGTSDGLCDITPYNIDFLAQAIVNHTNEVVGTSVDKRQETNDENFDYAAEKIIEFLKNNVT